MKIPEPGGSQELEGRLPASNRPAPLEYRYSHTGPSWDHSIVFPPVITALRAVPPDGAVLDIGCGNGYMMAEIRKMGPWRLYGTDSSESAVAMARSQGFDARLADGTANLLDSFDRESFDLIIGIEVIEHVYDPRGLLRQAYALLRPKRQLVLSTPYHGYLKNLAIAASGRCDSHYNPLWDCGHIKFWSRNTLSAVLKETGFGDVRFHGAGRFACFWKSMVLTATKTESSRQV